MNQQLYQMAAHHNPANAGCVSPAPTPPPSAGLPFDSLQQQLYNQQTLHHPHTILKNMNSSSNNNNNNGGGGSATLTTGHQVPHAAMSEMRVWLDYNNFIRSKREQEGI